MNDFDDLEELERELGPTLRVGLRRAAAVITGEPGPEARGLSRTLGETPAPRIDDGAPFLDPPRLLHALDDKSAEMLVVDPQRTRRDRTGRRPWLVAAAAVAAAVLVIAATVLLQGTGDEDIRTKPASPGPASTVPPPSTTGVTPPTTVPGDGSKEDPLLPEGLPSTPHIGELVASVAYFDGFAGGSYHLYADGRLIWWSDQAGERGGYVEQRLTPEGVERVRSEFLASGLFDPARPPSDVPPCGTGALTGASQVCVRGDDGLLRSAPESSPEATRLRSYLRTLDSSLPESEWADPVIRSYVPSRIAVCVQMYVNKSSAPPVPPPGVVAGVVQVPPDLSILLPLFPERAAELLVGREVLGRLDGTPEGASCFEMTLGEAQTLADAFLDPSGDGSHEYWGIVIRFNRQFDATQPDVNTGNAAYISFHNLLPDGVLGG